MDRHLLISSDRHAGLPSAQYRDDLDPQYRERFDVEFAAVQGQLPTAGELPEMREENAPGTRIGPEKSIFQDRPGSVTAMISQETTTRRTFTTDEENSR